MIDICRVVCFLFLVNSLPPIVSVIVRDRYGFVVDGGKLWFDGRPIFGGHKTIRGICTGVAGGILFYPLLGVTWWVAGGEEVVFLDQIFESLFPLLFLNQYLALNLPQNLAILLLFILTAFWSSRLWLHMTRRPLPKKYPRVIRSNIRIREWRACHEPLAKWQQWFNLTSFLSEQIFLTWLFKLTGLYTRGTKNALDIKIVEKTFFFRDLPDAFDGFRVLCLVDLHLDGLEELEPISAAIPMAAKSAGRMVDQF